MLTVWSVCWGDKYPDYYVQRLKGSVEKHLSLPHQFKCITDRDIPGVNCIEPVCDYPGWWQKVSLFKPGFASGENVYLDLDVVVVGSLDFLLPVHGSLLCPKNWAQSGHGGVQSSVMAWTECEVIWNEFDPAWAHWPPINQRGVLWGDQEHYTVLRDSGKLKTVPTDPEHVVSYKYHCRNGLPANTRIVVFHGDPKPCTVQEKWFEW